jgi:PAS domain S-box-containing protein
MDGRRCRPSRASSYPPAVATPTRPRRTNRANPSAPISDGPNLTADDAADPDGGHGHVHDLLTAVVVETARLLEADGAMVYLLDPTTRRLRFAHDAGIESPRSRAWVRSIDLPVGVGMFGRAVAERTVVVTGDYLDDPSFAHAEEPDRVVRDVGIHSMVVAPLVAGDEVFGALGTFSSQTDAFTRAQIGLVRALADHAAASMRNVRLIEALDGSRRELAERADSERSLREIAARISAATDLPAVLQLGVDEAARLLHADGARIDLIDPRSGLLRWAYASGAVRPDDSIWPDDPDETLEQGVSGQAVVLARPFWTGDYANDRRFPHGHGADTYVEATAVRSVMAAPLKGETGPFGALTVFTSRPDAWADDDAALLEAIADQAAITIRTTRLIDELDRSRDALRRRADAEQGLREIAARITVLRDPTEILQDVVSQAGRLVKADGVILDLLDPASGNLHWAMDDGLGAQFSDEERSKLWISVGVGATGIAVADDRVIVAEDDLAAQFPPSPESTAFYERTGFRSMIAAPITGESGPLGVIEVYSKRRAAFTQTDAGLVGALASQAAIAITNARLIDELDRSRADLARAADAERTLREIAARVSAMRDKGEILQSVIDASIRLLGASSAIIHLLGDSETAEAWENQETADRVTSAARRDPNLDPDAGVSRWAVQARRVVWTGSYLDDDRFVHAPVQDAFIREAGIRSVIAAPMMHRDQPVGVITVDSDRPDAFDADDASLLTALADQAGLAIANARLIEELERSRAEIARTADAERALRQIGARITAIREPGDLLQRIVDEARRLLRADGAVIDEFDPVEGVLVAAYDAGLSETQRTSVRNTRLRLGEGLAGKAMAERRVIAAGDYLAGDFVHTHATDELARTTDIGGLIVAPIVGDEGPLGAIEVYSRAKYAFDPTDEAILGGLADQAAIAITNARLIAELERSQAAVARRADTERALRDITARIAALREPDVILRRVVEEARRLLGSDGAHLTRMSETGTYLVPVVVAGSAEAADQGSAEADRSWLMSKRFPIGGGINGLAAERGEPVWTNDYLADARIPHDADDVLVAERLGLYAMAAAPLQAPGGEVIGTLAVSSATPRDFSAEELDLLQGLADQAAIAITNSTLLTRLTESEARYRYLIERAPDLVWSIGADARLTFLSDAVVRLTGRQPEEFLGQHFGALVHESSREVAEFDWTTGMQRGSQEVRGRVNLAGADGQPIPAEFIATARLDESGRFLGANGSVRDMREQVRLENELRESEGRYRFLIENAPDVVFATDAGGRLTFVSDALERMAGWRPEEVVGQPYTKIVDAASAASDESRWMALRAEPSIKQIALQSLKRPDGSLVPVEISAIGIVDENGEFAGIHGSSRDISERIRLERELRRQAGELAAGEERAHLARELHDSVTQALFSMTLVSRSIEMLLDRDVATARTHLTQLRELQREALAEMRALIFELRPGNLEQDGLTRALRTHTAALQGRIGLPVVVESSLKDRLPLTIEEVLYRIAQEALHNVVKHAGARQVRVELDRAGSSVRLRVQDDGKGFDPRAVPDGHLGLTGMRARADRIGATFTCRSEPGNGTTIEVIVPETAIANAGLVTGPSESNAIRDE